MKSSNVKWVFLREVRDQLRDRRTLFTIVVLPLLLYPLLGMSFLQIAQFQRENISPVLVIGADSLPDTPPLFVDGKFAESFCTGAEAKQLNIEFDSAVATSDLQAMRKAAEDAVHSGKFDTVLIFPADFADRLNQVRDQMNSERQSQPAASSAAESDVVLPEPEIFVNTAREKSAMARDRVARVLRVWRSKIVDDNLRQADVPIAATQPFQMVSTDVAHERTKRAAIWSKILPFVVLIWALTGAFYPAIDLCAGEKERGTLETLLCSPAERSEIVWGKLLTVMSFSMATSVLNMLSMGLTGVFIMSQIAKLSGGQTLGIGAPPLAAMGWLVVALIPISALFSALSLAIAAFARSSKEGQYYLMPLLMITLPLMMLPMMPGAELDLGTSLIPVTGVMLLLRALIEGQHLEALRFSLPVIGVTGVCCWFSIRWAIDQFNNESVLFRESEQWGIGLWLRHMVRDRRETPTLGEGIMCGVLLLIIHFFATLMVGAPNSWVDFATTTVVSLIAFIGAPALFMAVMLTRNVRKTLLLHLPRASTIPMTILLAVCIHPVGFVFGQGVQRVYPFSDQMLEQMQRFGGLLGEMHTAVGVGAVLLVIALVPAVCEEIAFRGFILSGLRHMGHRWVAILISSVFFGATHGILQQSLPACAIGIVIGYVAVQTRSLLPCIVLHCVYNSMSIVLAMVIPTIAADSVGLQWLFVNSDDGWVYRAPLVVVAALLSLLLLLWFRRLPFQATQEETLHEALEHQTAGAVAK
ncbi:MAG TPA: ABC transporter permease subunit/CPBP intramembrane protease [Pirellulaceae bacterium]|nr:ABC transporter permease subunit/CPBP intramembrane protease [Pirellulaceae bacterium]